MLTKLTGMAAALVLTLAALAGTASPPPQITGFAPFGAQRGVETELTVSGSNLLGNPRLLAPFAFKLGEPAPSGSDASGWKLKVTVDPETAIGVYPVRIVTDAGISNPMLIAVGQLPQVPEVEENSTFETAQTIPTPAVVEGQSAANDVDYFKFAGKKGQRIVVDAQCARIGSSVDPSIRLTTADHKFITSADDTPGLLIDARLTAVLPEDTDYVVEISDSRYQGGARPIYRLLIGEIPVADELYPIGGRRGETSGFELRGGTLPTFTIATARLERVPGVSLGVMRATRAGQALDIESLPPVAVSDLPELREPADPTAPPIRAAAPVVLNGRIDPPGDEDRFVLAVDPGQKLRVDVDAADNGSALDGILQILGAKNAEIAKADDTTTPVPGKKAQNPPLVITSPDPSLEFTVPAGLNEVTLVLRDLEGRGGNGFPYRITVTPVVPTFEIVLVDPQISIPRGGTAAVPVAVERKGFNGPITLKLQDPPAGLTVRPGTIADGQALGTFTISASDDLELPPSYLAVVGEALQGTEGAIVRSARKNLVFAQQVNLPTNVMTQLGLASASASALPVKLYAPSTPVEIVHGYGAPVVVNAERFADGDGALALSPLPLPPGLTVANAKIEEKKNAGTVTVTTTTDLPLGRMTLGLMAKGKLGGADLTIAAPAIALEVIRPVSLELAVKDLEVKPGDTVEIKGKIARKGEFKEPVTVKLNGLPEGLKADPATVAADATEFTLKIVADAKAAAANTTATAALAFQVNKKDYPSPPSAPLALKVLVAK